MMRSFNVSKGVVESLLKTGKRCSSKGPGEGSSGSLLKNEPRDEVGDWLKLHGGLGLSSDSAGLRADGRGLCAAITALEDCEGPFCCIASSWLWTK